MMHFRHSPVSSEHNAKLLSHPVSICKEIIQQDINQLMEIIGFTNEICNW